MEVSQNWLGSAHNLTQIWNEIYEFMPFSFYQIVDASLAFMTSNHHVYCFLKIGISKCPLNVNGKSNTWKQYQISIHSSKFYGP